MTADADERFVFRPVVHSARFKDANAILQCLAAERSAGLFIKLSRQPHPEFPRSYRPMLLVRIDGEGRVGDAVASCQNSQNSVRPISVSRCGGRRRPIGTGSCFERFFGCGLLRISARPASRR